ncbi:hypothetical protein CVT26_014002 [Gymnopilus dilepis]|uniref:Cas1p 10 TM acyl transferase domain-containing protein n=1 Tax=Gymnopilus dilepis TaxID=231916 RepID=A0A409VW55_9AGAR|nr:hypothetical protein CVT26_014002 [Gymnopilus dilepis]
MDRIFDLISVNNNQADGIVILPVETVAHSKLSPERASTMNPSDIDAMNSDLYHRINSPLNGFMSHSSARSNLSFPLVFNKMLHASLTEDGVHYSDSVVKIQAQILINLRCDNHHMPDKPPVDKTCCSLYPWPSLCQLLVLWSITLWAPYVAIRVSLDDIQRRAGDPRKAFSGRLAPYLVFSMSIALIYLADRTTLWEKEQKQFNAWTFGSLSVIALTIGFLSLQGSDTDLGFLNREQTEEWKGWMQIAILLYHYFGASKVSGIYNPIRVLVASYLFMTGYGHTMFYLRKADFGFTRLARVLIRLNLVTVVLPYTMNTDYISYYFTPLVSMWYIVVYATMSLGARFNDRIAILLAKILSSAVLMTWLMNDSWLLEALFDSLRSVFGIDWSVREWAFRVNLDIWIVYIGMLTALVVTKIREYHLDDHPRWPILVNMTVIASTFAMVWYFTFELSQESKFSYNSWHPYISFIPVLSFAILRNSTPLLRSTSSKAFAFVGRCSLETFIVQFHYWLAGDTKGVLLVVHGTQWRPLNFVITTIMFLYLSDRLAWATSNITPDICGNDQQSLPPPSSDDVVEQGNTTPLSPFAIKDEDINVPHLLEEPNATIWSTGDGEAISYARSTGHWLARQSQSWKLGAQLLVFFMVLWLLNIVWPYSDVFKD